MNRAFLPFAKSLFVALLAVSVHSQRSGSTAKVVKADPAKGGTIFTTTATPPATSRPAFPATAPPAIRPSSQNPKLSAQLEAYIYKQLVELHARRTATIPIMTPYRQGADRTRKSTTSPPSWTSSSPSRARPRTRTPSTLARRSTAAASPRKTCRPAPAATAPTAPASRRSFPRLAGQHQEYTGAQLTAFRAGTRKNSAQMTTIAKRLSDDEMKAVADYIAGLK